MISLTVGLPIWNSKKIAWLSMESLCAQKDIDFDWELIIMEEAKDYFGQENISRYADRLKKVGCVSIKYCSLDYKIGLPEKWKRLAEMSDENSEVFVFHSADDYPPPDKLKMAFDMINHGHDWVAYKKYLLYDMITGKTIEWSADSVSWKPGNLIACKTESIRNIPEAYIEKGVDRWLYNSIGPTNIYYDESESWKEGFCTDGFNNISKDRKKNFQVPQPPFFKTHLVPDLTVLKSRIDKEIVVSHNVEFGYELLSALPYAYNLHLAGKLEGTKSAVDTECLYFFSPDHKLDKKPRGWGNMPAAKNIPNIAIHQPNLDWDKFTPPPLKDRYKNDRFVFKKPIICICNRINVEWGKGVINYFDKDCLEKLFISLHKDYQIIYFNTVGRKDFFDGAEEVKIGEEALVKKYAINIQDIHKKNSDLSFNTLQLMVMANCESFITMNGGYGILASYFGGTNIIYSKECKEITPGVNSFYRWYHKLGNSRIVHVDNYSDLQSQVNDIFVDKSPVVNVIVRTHNRPENFKETFDSIKSQTYKNVNIIAGADNAQSEKYLQPYKCRQIIYRPISNPSIAKEGYGIYFPHNHYTNLLKDEAKEGWLMGLDDDDVFFDNGAIQTIVSRIKSEDDLLLWRVDFGGRLIPSIENFGKKPVVGDISGIGFMCHIKHLKGEIFTPYRRADFRLISQLYEKLNPVWINLPLTGPQNGKCNYGANKIAV